MTYSTDKCIKLLGYEYELPDEIILIIQKLVVKNYMKECVDYYNCMVYKRGVDYRHRWVVPIYMDEMYSDNRENNINPFRLYLKNTTNFHPWMVGLGYEPRGRIKYQEEIFGLKCISECRYWGNTEQAVRQYRLSLDDYTKAHMVEVMKNHGIKFNKSKKKSDLFNIFIKNKCFNIE
jgi:hypothetical protein